MCAALYVVGRGRLTVTSTTFIGDIVSGTLVRRNVASRTSLLSSIHDGHRYTSGVRKYSP
jgi:hypothetical protein